MTSYRIPAFATILLLLPVRTTHAQTVFERTYGGSDSDIGGDVRQTADGGYIIAGTTHSFGRGSGDVYLIRTDGLGDTLWTRTYGGPEVEEGKSVRETFEGGYAVLAATSTPGKSPEILLINTDSFGNVNWMRTYGDGLGDWGNAFEQTADSGFIIAGTTSNAGGVDLLALRLTSDGDTVWARSFAGPGIYSVGVSVRQTSDGGFVFGGRSEISDLITVGYVVRTNQSGDTLWTRTYPETCAGVLQLPDGGFGLAVNPRFWTSAMGITRTDSRGDTVWTRRYEGLFPSSIALTSDHGFVVSGTTSFPSEAVLLKTDSSGNSFWMQTFGGESVAGAAAAEQTSDGGYIMVGSTSSSGQGPTDVYLIKTNPEGTTGVEDPAGSEVPSAFSLNQNYPNPFNPTSSISYSLAEAGQVRLEVFNLLGQRVRVLVNSTQVAGDYTVRFDATGLPAGIYFYRLRSGESAETRSLVLLK